MIDRFTDRARKVIMYGKQEAQRLGHDFLGTEHILLGLVKEGTGVAANVPPQTLMRFAVPIYSIGGGLPM